MCKFVCFVAFCHSCFCFTAMISFVIYRVTCYLTLIMAIFEKGKYHVFSLYSIFKIAMLTMDFTHITIIVVLFSFTIVLMRLLSVLSYINNAFLHALKLLDICYRFFSWVVYPINVGIFSLPMIPNGGFYIHFICSPIGQKWPLPIKWMHCNYGNCYRQPSWPCQGQR